MTQSIPPSLPPLASRRHRSAMGFKSAEWARVYSSRVDAISPRLDLEAGQGTPGTHLYVARGLHLSTGTTTPPSIDLTLVHTLVLLPRLT